MIRRAMMIIKMTKVSFYVLPRSSDSDLSNSRINDMLAKVLKGVGKIDYFLKEIRAYILGISQKVGLYFTTIK